ncbi:hypothetical protein [Mycoplasma todarodis]|uniref:Uncharacterized protein n=1 Tax=Mycoplasma todarodis TaxID=1937191 RepID=A0A4R0XLY5_9MOLU|nr:hypothetical protein [Mycoplasma todarodis]TCG10432.1 hypothetical protein C4B25_04245 [Mycoplasma todarodis]
MKLKSKTLNILKKQGKLKDYNNLFANKQTRFLLTKIINILNPNANPDETAKLEMGLIKNEADMYIEGAKKIIEITGANEYEAADWESFGRYLYFVFQTGVFYHNKKNNVENIFINGDYVELNIEKKMLFNKFVDSLKVTSIDHNHLIKEILKVVL